QERPAVAEFKLAQKPVNPAELPEYLEQMRIMRDQTKAQGQDLMSIQGILSAAEREFAAHAFKSNPQAWYDYMDGLQRNPARYNDYVNSRHTERYVIQHMEPIDLVKIESDRVTHALSALGDKTKLTEYFRLSSDTRYTLSPDAMSRI